MVLTDIYNLLSTKNLENAFELIIQNESIYNSNSTYWCLRGDLCHLINELDLAISCYEKSLSLDVLNSIALDKLINLLEISSNQELYKFYLDKKDFIKTTYSSQYYKTILTNLNSKNYEANLNELQLLLSNSKKQYALFMEDYLFSLNGKIDSLHFFDKQNNYLKKYTILLPLNEKYIENVKYLIKKGINNFSVVLCYNKYIDITNIDEDTINEFKKDNRENTIVFHYLNESDSNVLALYKNIPNSLIHKYKRILLKGYRDFNSYNMARIPLIAKTSVSGHSLFLSYPCPSLMKNIEVGHGSMTIKASGAIDKLPTFAFSSDEYKHVDKICVSSTMDMVLWSACTGCNINQFLISGNPRTDLLLNSDGRTKLEKLLNTILKNKKIIFNMPTFHIHENSGRINGNDKLNNFIKIEDFDYVRFNKFLEDNNYICIFKVHHAEEGIISKKNLLKGLNNIYTISNKDLAKYNLDLYEILNAGDLLLTDYSSIYGDFLFMDKPTVFVNTDLDEYRKNRGLALEPYDFWTAGPKVQNQDNLELEIKKSLDDINYYKSKRDELKSVFHQFNDGQSSQRIWEYIDTKKEA